MSFGAAQRTLLRSAALRSSRIATRSVHTGPVPFKIPQQGSSKAGLKFKALTFFGLGIGAPWIVAAYQLTHGTKNASSW